MFFMMPKVRLTYASGSYDRDTPQEPLYMEDDADRPASVWPSTFGVAQFVLVDMKSVDVEISAILGTVMESS